MHVQVLLIHPSSYGAGHTGAVKGERGSLEHGKVEAQQIGHHISLHDQCAAIVEQVVHMEGMQAWQR
jgi:hypothetical protein